MRFMMIQSIGLRLDGLEEAQRGLSAKRKEFEVKVGWTSNECNVMRPTNNTLRPPPPPYRISGGGEQRDAPVKVPPRQSVLRGDKLSLRGLHAMGEVDTVGRGERPRVPFPPPRSPRFYGGGGCSQSAAAAAALRRRGRAPG